MTAITANAQEVAELMTGRRHDRYPIVQAEDDFLLDEPEHHITAAVNAGVIFACGYMKLANELHEDPCPAGFHHCGRDFYHLWPGQTWVDYHAAVQVAALAAAA